MTILSSRVQVLVFAFTFLIGSVSYAQQKSGEWVSRVAPKDCTFFAGWYGEIRVDANGSATEKWLAQKEMQDSIRAFREASSIYLKANPIESKAMTDLVEKLPWILLQQPFALYVGKIEPPPNPRHPPVFELGAVVELGEHRDWMRDWLDKAVAEIKASSSEEIQTVTIDEREFYLIQDEKEPESQAYFGMDKDRFLVAFGKNSMEKLLGNIDSPAPDWMSELVKNNPTQRLIGMSHINMRKNWKLIEQQEVDIPDFLHIEEIEAFSIFLGLRPEGIVSTSILHCPKKIEGLLSIIDVAPLSLNDVSEIPKSVSSVHGIRIAPDKVWELINQTSQYADFAGIDVAIQNLEEDSGLDFERDILKHLDGSIVTFTKLDLMNPTGGTILSVGLKDSETFSKHLKKIEEVIQDEAEFQGRPGLTKFELSGVPATSYPAGFANVCWCLIDDQLMFGLDQSALRSQIRKRKRKSGKLIQEDSFHRLFGNPDDPSDDPIGLSLSDYGNAIQVGLPAVSVMLGNSTPHPDFPFSMSDLPPVEVLVNGITPNIGGIYRDRNGFRLVEYAVIPGNSSVAVTGVLVGMLLPAVQQVRHAARRTASANNLRQLALSNLNYEFAKGSFPAAYTKNEKGEKLLSWRVHILPYLEEQKLYEQFHLDEPWDSPHNIKLVANMPPVFLNPASSVTLGEGMTTYLGVTGDDSVLAPPREFSKNGEMKAGVKLADIIDGSSLTLLVVDANSNNAVVWTKPEDFEPAADEGIRDRLVGHWVGDAVQAVFTDGSVHFMLGVAVDDEELRALMTKSDGKAVDLDR